MGTELKASPGATRLSSGLPVAGGVWDEATAKSHAALLTLLANPERLRLILAISQSPLSNVTQLAEDVGLSRNRVSSLLEALRRARYVRVEMCGRNMHYALGDDRINALLHALHGEG